MVTGENFPMRHRPSQIVLAITQTTNFNRSLVRKESKHSLNNYLGPFIKEVTRFLGHFRPPIFPHTRENISVLLLGCPKAKVNQKIVKNCKEL